MTFWQSVIFFRHYSATPFRQFATLLFAFVGSSLTEGIGILLLVPLLQLLQDGGSQGSVSRIVSELFHALGLSIDAPSLLTLFLVLIAAKNLAQLQKERQAAVLQHQVVDNLRHACFGALLKAEWRWLSTRKKSDYANFLLTDINRIGLVFHFSLQLLAVIVTALIYLGAAFLLSWPMSLLALVSGALGFIALRGQRRQALLLGQALGRANSAIQGTVQESLAGMRLAKILGGESRFFAEFQRATTALRLQQTASVAANSRARALTQILWACLLALYLYLGLAVLATPLAEVMALVLLFGRLIPLFTSAMQMQHHLLHALPALSEVQQLLKHCGFYAEPVGQEELALSLNRELELQGVTVRYLDRRHAALDSLSFTVKARTTTAVLGASGAGKSTLADVLMGLLSPDSGTLRVDGREIAGPVRIAWRRAVAYVPQDCFLFHDTIRANLLWACPEADEADLHQALQRAAADFVFGLPGGLATVVGDGGMQLSGGERQRLALARALLQRPALLILDEATSALDLESEAKVTRAIESLRGELTVLLIGHRLAALEHADQVIRLERGRVQACGTWQTLNIKTEINHGLAGRDPQ